MITPTDAPIVTTPEELLERAGQLVRYAMQPEPQLWMLLFDADGKQLPILPMLELEHVNESRLGDWMCSQFTTERESVAKSAAFVLERKGVARLVKQDLIFIGAIRVQCDVHEIPLRGVLLAHSKGVKLI